MDSYSFDVHGKLEVFPGGVKLVELLESFPLKYDGYCVPTKDCLLLIEDTILGSEDHSILFDILGEIGKVTGRSDFRPISANRSFVYESYQKALISLQKDVKHISDHDGNESAAEKDLVWLIKEAFKKDSSDIHIAITDDQQAKFFFRVDGCMDTTPVVRSKKDTFALVGSLFDYKGADKTENGTFHRDNNNSTSIQTDVDVYDNGKNKRVELRVNYRSQTQDEKSCIIRVISGSERFGSLEAAGVKDDLAAVFRKFICQSFGMILISGPTGAAKSTVLNCVIAEKPKNRVLHTVENPIESHHSDPLVFQGLMSDDVTKDIASFLRYDPDIGVVSEVRLGDEVLAAMALSRTGHLILSTIHATDAASVVDRLCNMGVSRDELAERNLLRMLTGQRLVPLLCNECKVPSQSTPESINQLQQILQVASPEAMLKLKKFAMQIHFESKNGCQKCGYTGRKGRQLVCEYIVIDDEARQFIKSGDSVNWIKSLKGRGWKSMADHTWELIEAGLVDPEVADSEVPEVLIGSDHWTYN